MDYTKYFFGKSIDDLAYSDIEKYFTESHDESDKIEFKSYYSGESENDKKKIDGIIRAVCALLNSEGGIVIWGAPIGVSVKGKKEKVFKGDLSPCDKHFEKDSFISKITDLITPSPHGIKFNPLEKNGKYVYIIEVEKSFYSPHQFRNVYYMRIDGQTKPAPHHFIEALFKKVTFPKLEGYLKFESYRNNQDKANFMVLKITSFIFNKSKLQNEHEIYFRLITSVGRFSDYDSMPSVHFSYELDGHELRMENAKSTLYYNEPYTISETIDINLFELADANYIVEFMLYFGGKKSPLMSSTYKMKLDNIDRNDLNTGLISIDENSYVYNTSDDLGISEVDRIKRIIGR